MTAYNGDNYAKQYVTKPSEKIEKGEIAGRKRLLFEKHTASLAGGLQVGDVIKGPFIPAGSLVTDAKIRIDKSLGATGIFDLGYLASTDSAVTHAADADAFVKSADAGGQAVLQRSVLTDVGIYKRFSKQVQMALTVTEVMDGNVLDGIIYMEVEYVND